jgi:hypothetical protein
MALLVEISFIIFIISAYVYFLYRDTINSYVTTATAMASAALTVGVVGTGAFYLYKNPDQIPSLLTKFLKKKT